jgi:7-cyano-7-deazaguanine synthase
VKRLLVLFSGGIDSTLALQWARENARHVEVLEVDHPARPEGERRAARRILRRVATTKRHLVRIPFDLRVGRPAKGYLASRNLLFHAIAQSLSEARGLQAVVAGHVRRDATSFADARPAFLERISRLAAAGRAGRRHIPIVTPITATARRSLAARSVAPLDWTWSCWRLGGRPCGVCQKCRERAKALDRLNSRPASALRTPKDFRARRG